MSTCVSCGTQNEETAKYCLECGCSFMGGIGQLLPKTVLEGRYIIIRTLGRGGMGAVYLALDQRLNNTSVAIKEMSTNAVGKGSLKAAMGAFKQEAAMLISLRHLALPRIIDFFSQGDNRGYLVMDYIEGENLKSIAKRRGLIPEAEVLDWAKQLCGILEYLHSQKPPVIFRDLKPANIMRTPQGQIKLIDFGIARHFRRGQTSDTTAYGSQGFAPPEQFGQNQTDARSDIYALGATLHYLLTGVDSDKNPFMFEPPSKYVKVSPEFEAAIMKSLEFKAQDRLGSAGEMLTLLQTLGVKKTPKFTIPITTQVEEKPIETTPLSQIELSQKLDLDLDFPNNTVLIKETLSGLDLKQINQEVFLKEPQNKKYLYKKKDFKIKGLYILAGVLVLVAFTFGLSSLSSKEEHINVPKITWPVNGANLEKGNIKAQWNSVAGAVEYKYAIRNLTSDSVIIPTTKTLQPGFLISSTILTLGHQYKVWVAAVDKKGKVFDATNVFTVKNALPALATPEITSPKKERNGSDFYRKDIRDMWNWFKEAVKYDYYVKNLSNGL